MISRGFVRGKFDGSYIPQHVPSPQPTSPSVSATLLNPLEAGTPEIFSPVSMKQMGYTGNSCGNCQSMRMKVSGHCEVCEDCGTTTGCS